MESILKIDLLTVFLSLTFIAMGYIFNSTMKSKKKERNWPVVQGAKPFIGNSIGSISNYVNALEGWCDEYGEKGIFEVNIFGQILYVICSDEKAQYIESKRPFDVIRDRTLTQVIDSVGANGLFSAEGKNWAKDRKMVSPHFNRKHIEDYLPTVKTVSQRLCNKWSSMIQEEGAVSISPGLLALTIDIISLVAFAMDLNCVEKGETEEGKDVIKIFEKSLLRILAPFSYWKIPIIGKYLDGGEFAANRLKALFYKLIDEYEEEVSTGKHHDKENTFLGKVIATSKKEKSNLDRERLAGNFFTLFAAGAETSHVTMVSTLYEIAKDNSGLQDELLKEALGLGDLDKVTVDDLETKLPRMRSLLYEVLRIRGPAVFRGLESNTALEIEGIKLPPKTVFLIMDQYISQQESDVKERGTPKGPFNAPPKEFCPRRYLVNEDNSTKLSVVDPTFKTGFRSFGSGARVCPGRKFAEAEILYTLSLLLRSFHVALEDGHLPMKLVSSFTQQPDVDVRLVLNSRK